MISSFQRQKLARERDVAAGIVTRVLHLRLKDKHAVALRAKACEVNTVWNFDNASSQRAFERERRFLNAADLHKLTVGAGKSGLSLHSQTIQAVNEEFVTRRKQFKKIKLRWRVSNPKRANRSLGWIPFKKSAIRYCAGQVHLAGEPLSLWDSYGLANYELGSGSICEDASGRWYLNVSVKVKKAVKTTESANLEAIGIDLGLKDFMVDSNGNKVEAKRFYRDLEPKIAVAQRAGKRGRTRALHAKIANRRKDFLHKLSTAQVSAHSAIFVGNVNASALAQTKMAKSVLDAGWSAYRTMVQYKGDSAGTWFAEIDESFSTQGCNACGAREGPKGLSGLAVRRWACGCGLTHDRDINSALVIKKRGLLWLEKQFAIADSRLEEPSAAMNKTGHIAPPRPDMAVQQWESSAFRPGRMSKRRPYTGSTP
jgi:transposase